MRESEIEGERHRLKEDGTEEKRKDMEKEKREKKDKGGKKKENEPADVWPGLQSRSIPHKPSVQKQHQTLSFHFFILGVSGQSSDGDGCLKRARSGQPER